MTNPFVKKDALRDKMTFKNVRELVEYAGETHGEKIAYSYRPDSHRPDIEKIDFLRLRDDIRALSTELLSMGCAGKHIALIGKFSYEWALVYFSALSIGAVLVPLDRDWLAEDLADTVKRADAEFLFCDKDIADKADCIALGANISTPTVWLGNAEKENSLASLISSGNEKFSDSDEPYFSAPIDENALSLLVFTSGTTGKGKGVMLSQKAILSDVADVVPYIDFTYKTVGVLPPHHTYGSSVMLIGHTMIGAEVYISAGLRYIPKELKEQKPGHMILVPLYLETFYRRIQAGIKEKGQEKTVARAIKLSNASRKVGIDLRAKLFGAIRSSFGGELKTVICGGAPLNPEIVEFFDAIGITILNGYGITECAPIVAVNRSRRRVSGSVGTVLDIDKVKIDSPNESGEGEILVKGPNVMLGYYKDEAATADAMTPDGYFRTGDYGRLDENNSLFITGRKKNLIILSNGKNVYPEEIENEFVALPGVVDIIVYEGQSCRGIEHNAITAEIYPDYSYFEANGIPDIKAHLKNYVDDYNRGAVPYKKIGVLKVRKDEFPKNTLRKILRFKLDMSID